jgi:hypothetical protein
MNVLHSQGHKDIVLIPRPTADPDDPLNWSRSRKYISLFCTMTYVWMIGISSAAIYSVFGPISTATGLPLHDLNAGTGYMFLMFGWGCLVWQPLALTYGRRGVYLFSMLATIVCFQIYKTEIVGHKHLGRPFIDQRHVDCSSSSTRFRRCTHRISLRDLSC